MRVCISSAYIVNQPFALDSPHCKCYTKCKQIGDISAVLYTRKHVSVLQCRQSKQYPEALAAYNRALDLAKHRGDSVATLDDMQVAFLREALHPCWLVWKFQIHMLNAEQQLSTSQMSVCTAFIRFTMHLAYICDALVGCYLHD